MTEDGHVSHKRGARVRKAHREFMETQWGPLLTHAWMHLNTHQHACPPLAWKPPYVHQDFWRESVNGCRNSSKVRLQSSRNELGNLYTFTEKRCYFNEIKSKLTKLNVQWQTAWMLYLAGQMTNLFMSHREHLLWVNQWNLTKWINKTNKYHQRQSRQMSQSENLNN